MCGSASPTHSSRSGSAGASRSTEVVAPCSRAPGQQLARGGAAEELGSAEVEVRDPAQRRTIEVVEGEGAVGADAVPGRAVAVRAHGEHRGGRLVVVLARQPAGVDALAAEQREQGVADRVGAHGADAEHLGAEPGETTPVPPAVPAGDIRMVSTTCPSLRSGIDSMPTTWVSSTCTPTTAIFMTSPAVRSCGRARRGRRSCSWAVSTRGVPSALVRWCSAASHSSNTACSTAWSRLAPSATEPWLAISATWRPSSAARTCGSELGAAEGGVRRHRHGAAEQQLLVVQHRQLGEAVDARNRRRPRRVGVHDGARLRPVGQHAEVQPDLGGRREVALDHLAGGVHEHDVLGPAPREHHAGGGDGDQAVVRAGAHVAGGADEQPLGGEVARGGGDLIPGGHRFVTPRSPRRVACRSR